LPVLALAFLVKIVLFLPSAPQSYHCPNHVLFDTRDHLESRERIVAKFISLVLAKSKINPILERKSELFHLLE